MSALCARPDCRPLLTADHVRELVEMLRTDYPARSVESIAADIVHALAHMVGADPVRGALAQL